jgi:hypothetical protein
MQVNPDLTIIPMLSSNVVARQLSFADIINGNLCILNNQ